MPADPVPTQSGLVHWIAGMDHAEEVAWTEDRAQEYRDAGWSVWGPFVLRDDDALRQWQDAAAKASKEIIACDKKIASLRQALREAIGWSYGAKVTPERRDELEGLING